MSVAKPNRRQGIGQHILRELCHQAYQKNYSKAILETTDTWQNALAFYQAFGFQITHYVAGDVYFALDLREYAEKQFRTKA